MSFVDSMGQFIDIQSDTDMPFKGFLTNRSYLACESGGSLRALGQWWGLWLYHDRCLQRVDGSGSTQWTFWLMNYGNFSDMQETPTGDFLILTNTGDQGGSTLILLSEEGDTVRTTTINAKLDVLDQLTNGEVLLYGTQGSTINYVTVDASGVSGPVTIMDQEGSVNMIGHRTSTAGNYTTAFTTDLSDGRKALHEMRWFPDGTLDMQVTLDTLPNGLWRLSSRGVSNDDLLITGSLIEEDSSAGFIQRQSGSGERLWRRTYNPNFPDNTALNGSFRDVIEISANSYFVFGTRLHDVSTNSKSDLWLIKVDADGCIVPGCNGVGITEQATNLKDALTIFPNPVAHGGSFTIALDLPPSVANDQLQLTVVAADGRVVHQQRIQGSADQLTTTNWATGLYHLHISTGTKWLTGGNLVVE